MLINIWGEKIQVEEITGTSVTATRVSATATNYCIDIIFTTI